MKIIIEARQSKDGLLVTARPEDEENATPRERAFIEQIREALSVIVPRVGRDGSGRVMLTNSEPTQQN